MCVILYLGTHVYTHIYAKQNMWKKGNKEKVFSNSKLQKNKIHNSVALKV